MHTRLRHETISTYRTRGTQTKGNMIMARITRKAVEDTVEYLNRVMDAIDRLSGKVTERYGVRKHGYNSNLVLYVLGKDNLPDHDIFSGTRREMYDIIMAKVDMGYIMINLLKPEES